MKKSVIKVCRAIVLDWSEDSQLLAYVHELVRKNSDCFAFIYSAVDAKAYLAITDYFDNVDAFRMFEVFCNLSKIFNEVMPLFGIVCECEDVKTAEVLQNLCDMQEVLDGDGVMGSRVNNCYCNMDKDTLPRNVLDAISVLLGNLDIREISGM